ncbi:zinc finger and SCAN domain-containing protein 10-like [Scaptodrosophila lebanonensis]|uniref:Zinc finger and SCAN domain-containing protein 10-like n=1 Tax=Drosophila lebanonensis TaxID=7225 RepID=A0A6J2TP14_DROLE|nr:zinc finger and SCAN domain-containing protein 10-like [Scaptodrosophila lebanonensis]
MEDNGEVKISRTSRISEFVGSDVQKRSIDPLDEEIFEALALNQDQPSSPTQDACLEEPLLMIPVPETAVSTADNTEVSPEPVERSDDIITDVNWEEPYAPQLLKHQQRRLYKTRNKPNVCTYCGRTFRRRYLLDSHLNIHTGARPHQCEMCGKQFRAVSTLTRHLRTHEQREAFQCQHCEKLFTHRSALLSHEMRHTQQRRWPCDSCSKSFYTQNQMDTHRRKLHAKPKNATTDYQADADRLPFTCDLCGNSYRSASMLSTHKLKKHYRLAKYKCEQCGQKFVDDDRLRTHQFIHVESIKFAKEPS